MEHGCSSSGVRGPGNWADPRRAVLPRPGTSCGAPGPAGLTAPARPAAAAAPNHVDVTTTWSWPPRCHIDAVTGALRKARTRTICTTHTASTTRPPHLVLTPREPHPCRIVPVGRASTEPHEAAEVALAGE